MHWRAQVRWMLKKISKCFHKVKDDKCLAPSVCHRWDASVRQHVILIPTRIRLRMIFTLALPFFFLHVKYFMIKRHLRLFFSHYHHVGFHSRAPGFILFGPKARSLFECLGCERERVTLCWEYWSFYIQSIFMDTFSTYVGEGLSLK